MPINLDGGAKGLIRFTPFLISRQEGADEAPLDVCLSILSGILHLSVGVKRGEGGEGLMSVVLSMGTRFFKSTLWSLYFIM